MNEIKIQHKGVEITYNEKANTFDFIYDGGERSAPSLAAAKAAIDKKPKFKEIKVYTSGRYDNRPYETARITSIVDKGRSAWIVLGDGDRQKVYPHNCFPITPENTRLVQAILEKQKQIDNLTAERDSLKDQLTTIDIPPQFKL